MRDSPTHLNHRAIVVGQWCPRVVWLIRKGKRGAKLCCRACLGMDDTPAYYEAAQNADALVILTEWERVSRHWNLTGVWQQTDGDVAGIGGLAQYHSPKDAKARRVYAALCFHRARRVRGV